MKNETKNWRKTAAAKQKMRTSIEILTQNKTILEKTILINKSGNKNTCWLADKTITQKVQAGQLFEKIPFLISVKT